MLLKMAALSALVPMQIAPLLFAQSLVWQERRPLPLPRGGYMAGVIGKKYVIAGGTYWKGNQKHWTDHVDIFDPFSNLWTKGPSLPEPRGDAASVSSENTLYIFGVGANGSIRRDSVAFRNGKWFPVPVAELPEPRLYPVATICRSKVYLLGGLSKPGDYTSISNTLWVWDIRAAKAGWKALNPMPGPGLITHAMAEMNGKIYVLGGAKTVKANVVNVTTAYEFDPQSQKWTQLPDLAVGRRCWSGVEMDDKILLIGGYTETFERDVFTYEPTSHTLTLLGQLPHGLCDAKFVRINNSILGTGGEAAPRVRGQWTIEGRWSRRKRPN
jgi:N-acetylneuraminic acid mutarotase